MRKIAGLLIVLLFFCLTLSPIFAQTEPSTAGTSDPNSGIAPRGEPGDAILPVPQQQILPFFGQDHYYTVTFRGNGEAIVAAKLLLTNSQDTSLQTLTLRLPKGEPKDLSAYQVLKERYCISPYVGVESTAPCRQYQEPNYMDPYAYYGGSAQYQKAITNYNGDTISVTLPRPIAPNKTGAYILYFRTFGYTQKNIFGAYEYTFETLKIDEPIRQLNIGITTDSDQVLSGTQQDINYRFTGAEVMNKASLSDSAIRSPQVDQFYQELGSGRITKQASNLQALESYTVTGSYADSTVRLYMKQILIVVGVCVGLVLLIIGIIRFVMQNQMKVISNDTKNTTVQTAWPIISVGLSFVSAFLLVLYTIAVYFAFHLIQQFPYYGTVNVGMFLVLLLLVISFVVYALIVFLPALYIGMKKGMFYAGMTLICTMMWVVLFSSIVFVVFVFGKRSPNDIRIYPTMMDKSLPVPMSGRAVDDAAE